MNVGVRCARNVQLAYVTLHHRGCTLVPPSTWANPDPPYVYAFQKSKQSRPLKRTNFFFRGLTMWAEARHQGLDRLQFWAFYHPLKLP